MIFEDIADYALSRSSDLKIDEVIIGLGYTGVKLSDGSAGISYTFRDRLSPTCSVLGKAGSLESIEVDEMIRYFLSQDVLEATLGLATINAILNKPDISGFSGDILDLLEIKPNDKVGMIGFFGPLIPDLKKKCKDLYVFDESRSSSGIILPPDKLPEILPTCSVVIITATSLINKTFHRIIELCRDARERCILGPSTPLCPEIFKKYGVTCIAGVKVIDPERVLKIISQGGGTRNFKDSVEKVVIPLE